MEIYFIRHGKTKGNLERRYIGRTDEPLCESGICELKAHNYPKADFVISSPMKRCQQTANIIFPNQSKIIFDGLQECDFGDFEGKNYKELCANKKYLHWLESKGTLPFPNGESHKEFVRRCVKAFADSVSMCEEYKKIAYVIHGGTIMAIMEEFAVPKKSFYDYQIKCGCGYKCVYDCKKITIAGEIS